MRWFDGLRESFSRNGLDQRGARKLRPNVKIDPWKAADAIRQLQVLRLLLAAETENLHDAEQRYGGRLSLRQSAKPVSRSMRKIQRLAHSVTTQEADREWQNGQFRYRV